MKSDGREIQNIVISMGLLAVTIGLIAISFRLRAISDLLEKLLAK